PATAASTRPTSARSTASGSSAVTTSATRTAAAAERRLAATSRRVGPGRFGLRAEAERPAYAQVHGDLAGTLAVGSRDDRFPRDRVRIEVTPGRMDARTIGIGGERGPVVEQAVTIQIPAGDDIERPPRAHRDEGRKSHPQRRGQAAAHEDADFRIETRAAVLV